MEPKEIIHHTAEDTDDLHKKVGGELKVMGQPSQTVPAHEQPVLGPTDIAEIVGHTVSSGIEKTLYGKGPDTDVRVTPGGRLRKWALGRAQRIRELMRSKAT